MAIEKQLRVEDFHLVRQRFNHSTTTTRDRPAGRTSDSLLGRDASHGATGCLTKEEFLAAFEPILDPKQSNHELIKLFDKVPDEKFACDHSFSPVRILVFVLAQFERNRPDQRE